MIRKKILTISVVFIVVFILTTNFLLAKLTTTGQEEVKTIQDQIYALLSRLEEPKFDFSYNDDKLDAIITNLNEGVVENNFKKLWDIANSWLTKSQVVDLNSPYLKSVLHALKTAKIVKADLDTRGTQLKLYLTLQNGQNVVFKPKWYDKWAVIEGPVYAGKDRYGSEVIAFYLSAILNLPFVPCSVRRTISLTNEIMPVATDRLKDTSFKQGNRTCVFGKCFYCKKEDPVCEDKTLSVDGAVIFNINGLLKHHRSPWQRTYKQKKKAVWEESNNYCSLVKEKLTKKRLLDLIDTSIFDFFIQNGDRHHYETLHDIIVLLDNGKGFGNPNISHLDILAPLYQCCMLRTSTLKRLRSLSQGILTKKLARMPDVEDLITPQHLKALDERLLLIFAAIEYCNNNRNKLEQAAFS